MDKVVEVDKVVELLLVKFKLGLLPLFLLVLLCFGILQLLLMVGKFIPLHKDVLLWVICLAVLIFIIILNKEILIGKQFLKILKIHMILLLRVVM
ncbi:MAG: hypothetical protein DBX97_23260 [Collinsella tanakaei]|nr:MAG: hypothetical protein DBX97_23260 [Collinsella tanakaei]